MAIIMLKLLSKLHKICKFGGEELKLNIEPLFQLSYFFHHMWTYRNFTCIQHIKCAGAWADIF